MTWLILLAGWALLIAGVLALCRMSALSDIDAMSDHEFFERVDDNGDLH